MRILYQNDPQNEVEQIRVFWNSISEISEIKFQYFDKFSKKHPVTLPNLKQNLKKSMSDRLWLVCLFGYGLHFSFHATL